eukprot:157977_1
MPSYLLPHEKLQLEVESLYKEYTQMAKDGDSAKADKLYKKYQETYYEYTQEFNLFIAKCTKVKQEQKNPETMCELNMETLIKFRLLIDQLTIKESNKFFNQLIQLSNVKNLIITSLFSYLSQSILKRKQSNQNPLQNINKLLLDIIDARNKHSNNNQKSNQNKSRTLIKFDEFPSQLISIISSFLSLDNYINLQHVSRRIYIGCNSPLSLQRLHLPTLNNTTFNISKYSNIKELSCNLSTMYQFPVTFWNTCDRLKCIKIKFDVNYNSNRLNIGFDNINRLALNFENQSLHLSNFV